MAITVRVVRFDARDPHALAAFWAGATEGEIASEWPTYVVVRRRGGECPSLGFQQVAEGKVVKNRLHLDLSADDLMTEIDRLVGLGASVLERQDNGFHRWVVLRDPEGNEFCVSEHAAERC